MSVVGVNSEGLAPAAKNLHSSSGQATGSPGAVSPGQAAEADNASRVGKPLLIKEKPELGPEFPATTLQFSVDPEHRRVFIKVSDLKTGRVIIEAPPEQVARVIDHIIEMSRQAIDLEA